MTVSCNDLRVGRLPCLHDMVERPDRNSISLTIWVVSEMGDSSWRFTNPRPSLAPRFRNRASVQPHARPLVSLRPGDLLLNTAEWGHEKQISSRGHASPGCMTVL